MDRHAIGRGIIDGTLAKLEATEHCIALTTYSRSHGRSRRFLMLRKRIRDIQDGEYRFDSDIYSFLEARRMDGNLRMRITWLDGSYDRVHGHIEEITIPHDLLEACLSEGKPVCHLHYEHSKTAKLDFSSATRTIREICGNRLIKRAFLKGICRNFQWKSGEIIRFFNDGGSSFFFREGERGMCGGFILHHNAGPGRAGQETRVYYSVHT